MIKKLILILIFILGFSGSVFAYPTQKITPEISTGMKQYRAGNYTACIQTLRAYAKAHKTEENQLVTYYLGMAYAQAGHREEALKYYEMTTKIFPDNMLAKYAKKGIACVNGDESICNPKPVEKKETENKTELDKFVKAPYGNGLSADLTKELERRRIEALRKKINTDVEINRYEFKDFRDFSKKTSAKENDLLIASSKPSDAEVLKAIRVLNDAGLNNIAGQAEASMNAKKYDKVDLNNTTENFSQEPQYQNKPDMTAEEYQRKIQKEMMQAQIESMAQPNINALFGNNNNNNNNGYNNNNNMMNMLPFLMMNQAQQSRPDGTVDPRQQAATQEMMQAIMLNQMMPNFNFGSSNNGGF